jgi:hypothetical protein
MKDKHDVVISQPTVARILKDIRPKFDLKGAVARDAEKARADIAARKAAKQKPRVTISHDELKRVVDILAKNNKMVAKNLAKNIKIMKELKAKGLDKPDNDDWRDATSITGALRNPPRANAPEDQALIDKVAARIDAWAKQPAAMKGGMDRGDDPHKRLHKLVRKYMKKMRDEFLDLIEINSQVDKLTDLTAVEKKFIMDEIKRRVEEALESEGEDTASEEE